MVIVDNGKESRHRRQIVIRGFTLEQFDDGATNAPDIRRRASSRELYNLRGHPVRCSDHLGLLVRPSQGARRDTKICELDGAVFCCEDVGAFDVPVDHTLVVEILQALEDLGHIYADEVFGKLAVGFAY